MDIDKIKQYSLGLFLNVGIYLIIDIIFAGILTSLLVGSFYISTLILGDLLPFETNDILLSGQIIFVIFLLAIIYTSVGQIISFKKNISKEFVRDNQDD
ncbi:MAG: hypothetical protein RPU63_11920 [Candidatus Sedimenticola sp. (ex Thyasira tokunagai)]